MIYNPVSHGMGHLNEQKGKVIQVNNLPFFSQHKIVMKKVLRVSGNIVTFLANEKLRKLKTWENNKNITVIWTT